MDLPHRLSILDGSRTWRFSAALMPIALLLCAATAPAADFGYPLSVGVADETIFVADRSLPGLWSIVDGSKKVFFQGSKKSRTPLNAVRCVAVDRRGRLIVGDSSTRQVYRFDGASPLPLLKSKRGIGIPMGLAVDRQDNIFVADLESQRIWRLSADGDVPEPFAEVPAPRGMAIDGDDRLWLVSHGANQLVRVATEGTIDVVISGRPFEFPNNVAVDDRGSAYVADGYARAIWKIDQSGRPERWIAGEPLKNPVGLCWARERLLIADPHAKGLFAADREGRLSRLSPAPSAP